MPEISSHLYWMLPGSTEFTEKITDAARKVRSIFLSLTEHPPNGIWATVRNGLNNAGIPEPVELTITSGMNVALEVGMHFGGGLMPGASLAHHAHPLAQAVVLVASGKDAMAQCSAYAGEFVQALEYAQGNVILMVALQDGEMVYDTGNNVFRVIAFDGWLDPDAIDAYITHRMVGSSGPGSTRLLKQLVTEFAGYDAHLAERLLAMEPSRILGLPDTLTDLLAEDGLRWTSDSWVSGSRCDRLRARHPLREWYLATHAGLDATTMRRASAKRYWRACLKCLIPWMEERRPALLEKLDGPLTKLEAFHGGPGQIEKKVGNIMIRVGREDLEVNDLHHNFNRSVYLVTSVERAAANICKIAKQVRDDLSHLRPPTPSDIMQLITEMDALLPT